ncbi:MAG TPA: hypothetical protein VHB46_17905 [Burkholderiales bacterium]|nr:hypothetical protein [Burkholderiales bacterium]
MNVEDAIRIGNLHLKKIGSWRLMRGGVYRRRLPRREQFCIGVMQNTAHINNANYFHDAYGVVQFLCDDMATRR